MKKKIIIAIIIAVLTGCNVFTGYEWHKSFKTNKEYFNLIEKQSATIDSLVNNPATSIKLDVSMQLTDKSKFEISAKNNQGTISIPNERKYLLEVQLDSVSIFTEK